MAKRFLDIVIAVLALLVFLPFGLVIALILKLTGEGEVFFVQERIGRNLTAFPMLKFTTMRKDSASGSALTVRNDPRVFPFGRLLRMTKLNEVPQLLNVLKGEMTIVGPRPMLRREMPYLPEEVNHRVYAVAPGATGIGSLVFRDEEQIMSASPKGTDLCYREDIAPLKADLEIWYAQHQSLWLDLRIMFLTAWQIIRPQSRAYGRLLGADWPEFERRIDVLCPSANLAHGR